MVLCTSHQKIVQQNSKNRAKIYSKICAKIDEIVQTIFQAWYSRSTATYCM